MILVHVLLEGQRWRSWFRQCVTREEVAGSIPNGVIAIFPSLGPHSVVLWSTQVAREMSTWGFNWGNSGRCLRLTTVSHSCADFLKVPGA